MPMFESLSLNGGYRYSSYSSVGAVSSYKASLKWQVIDDVSLRASYNRATRAPNVLESFSPNNVVLFGGQDPCVSLTTGECASVPNAGSGKTGVLYCPASQCNQQVGGNINLKPETGDTKSVGIVFTPTFFSGFTLTVDYWDIKVSNYISPIGANTILSGCYGSTSTATQQAFFCPLVHRASSGALFGAGYVQNIDRNLPYLATSGIDFEANYATDMDDWGLKGYGSLAANFVGTYLGDLITKSSQFQGQEDCRGYFGAFCGTPNPNWRHKLRVTWTSPWDFDISLQWRHLSSVKLDEDSTDPLKGGGVPAYAAYYPCANGLSGIRQCFDAKIPAYDYFDLSGTWAIREGVDLRAGVDNIFDKSPPAMDTSYYGVSTPPFGNGNTYPNVYDSLGRTIFVGVTIKY
jgi:outer membrane receptor protein involved in Fe transport